MNYAQALLAFLGLAVIIGAAVGMWRGFRNIPVRTSDTMHGGNF